MTEEEIRAAFPEKESGRRIHAFDSVDSTNTFAKEIARSGAPKGTLVVAEKQTAGRGRFSRTWQSPPGKNLTFTIILRPGISPDRFGILSLFGAVAVCKGIESASALRPQIKWPNDILLEGKKVCGILVETQTQAAGGVGAPGSPVAEEIFAVLGIGLNVNQQDFPEELAGTAISMAISGGQDYDRKALLAKIVISIESNESLLEPGQFDRLRAAWLERSPMIGAPIAVQNGSETIRGTASRLGECGELVLATESGERRLFAGDVTIIK
jgi:BirA family biotin operon repressor/biotin-[acetyl-CoA-carboxylase] ligase